MQLFYCVSGNGTFCWRGTHQSQCLIFYYHVCLPLRVNVFYVLGIAGYEKLFGTIQIYRYSLQQTFIYIDVAFPSIDHFPNGKPCSLPHLNVEFLGIQKKDFPHSSLWNHQGFPREFSNHQGLFQKKPMIFLVGSWASVIVGRENSH